MVSFLIQDIDADDWKRFKDSIPRSTTLEEAFRQIIGGEVVDERAVDSKGRVRLGPDHAGKTVRVHVVELDEPDE